MALTSETALLLMFHHLRTQQMLLLLVLCLCMASLRRKRKRLEEMPIRELRLTRQRVRNELLDEIRANPNCRSIICMSPDAFVGLCKLLSREGGLRPTQRVSVQEQVAQFLLVLSRNLRNHIVSFFFGRSIKASSSHFHRVLRAIIMLEEKFLRQPSGDELCPEVQNNPEFYPYFKDCMGAIDGTHVRVRVSREDARRYRGRKGYPTQNVMTACTFGLRFSYVLAGWEGSASDSRIVKNAMQRDDKLVIPNGKYYLVDLEYPHTTGLMTPYRGVRYHMKDYLVRGPENAQELFNHRHSSLRNTIERALGVLKKRFPIIGSTSEPTYSAETQSEIVFACCILHNYLMVVDPDEELIAQVDHELLNQEPEQTNPPWEQADDLSNAEQLRDSIAKSMWNDYLAAV